MCCDEKMLKLKKMICMQVRSVSQLKRDMVDVDLFYLDSATTQSETNRIKSQSLESINTNPTFTFNKINKNNRSFNEYDVIASKIYSSHDSNPFDGIIQNDSGKDSFF